MVVYLLRFVKKLTTGTRKLIYLSALHRAHCRRITSSFCLQKGNLHDAGLVVVTSEGEGESSAVHQSTTSDKEEDDGGGGKGCADKRERRVEEKEG